MEIIPVRFFPQIRINFPVGNHPCQTFPVNQDQFTRRKSSLQKLFIKSGSISPTEIIPPRHFYQIRITPPPKMHPQPRFQANQDNSLTKSPFPNASPTASKSSRSNFSHQRRRHIIVTFKLYPPVKKPDLAISKIWFSLRTYDSLPEQVPQQPHMLVSIKFRAKYVSFDQIPHCSKGTCKGACPIRILPRTRHVDFIRSVPLRLQREWFLSHSLQDRLPGTGMHLPPPAARPCGRAESEHIRVSPFPPAGWQPCPFW